MTKRELFEALEDVDDDDEVYYAEGDDAWEIVAVDPVADAHVVYLMGDVEDDPAT